MFPVYGSCVNYVDLRKSLEKEEMTLWSGDECMGKGGVWIVCMMTSWWIPSRGSELCLEVKVTEDCVSKDMWEPILDTPDWQGLLQGVRCGWIETNSCQRNMKSRVTRKALCACPTLQGHSPFHLGQEGWGRKIQKCFPVLNSQKFFMVNMNSSSTIRHWWSYIATTV